MKRIVLSAFVIVMMFLLTFNVSAAGADTLPLTLVTTSLTPTPTVITIIFSIDNKTYNKNGVPAEFDVAPYIDPSVDRTMVPIRFIAEAFGATVNWVDNDQADYIYLNSNSPLKITVNQPLPDNMGTAVIVKDRLFVPIRYISEQLGAMVSWDVITKTVTLSMQNAQNIPIVGGYTPDRAVTKEDLVVFNEAMTGNTGINCYRSA